MVFTSGATGPAKGVVYRHRQVLAQLDLVRDTYATHRPRTGWSPRSRRSRCSARRWASAPRCPTSTSPRPAPLTAAELADAAAAVDATVVFASPAALRSVVATATGAHRPRSGRRWAGSGC